MLPFSNIWLVRTFVEIASPLVGPVKSLAYSALAGLIKRTAELTLT
jgi:hypothetical protein